MSSAMGGAPANRQVTARPPEKGSFPLDHFNECRTVMEAYLACMKTHDSAHALCRNETTAYLQCRMNKGLMSSEDVSNFGLKDPIDFEASQAAQQAYLDRQTRKLKEGFVAGLSRGEGR